MKKPKSKSPADHQGSPRPASRPLKPQVTVLHIDDDPNDLELFQAAAKKANVQFCVQNVTDGEQAMAYLTGRGRYANRRIYPMPALILLDLKMPRATGFDVLGWIRNHPEVGNLPVVIFSGSELRDDIQQAYASGADSYMVKPIGFTALVDLVKDIESAWIGARRPANLELTGWRGGAEWIADSGAPEAHP